MNWYNRLKNHQLEKLNPITYRLYDPKYENSRMMSVLIIFTPENIVITGDLSPGKNGIISATGYGEKWFSRKLSPNYLAEKFLSDDVYEEDRAIEEFEHWLKWQATDAWECRDRKQIQFLRRLRDEVKANSWIWENGQHNYDFFSDYIIDYWEHVFGYGYDSNDYDLLAGIQQRFSELKNEED